MTAVLLTARFVLELALLAAFAAGGWRLPESTAAQVALAATLPPTVAVVWGWVVSPKARAGASLPVRLVVEVSLFGAASALLWVTGSPTAAVVLIAAEAVVLGGLLAVGSPPGPSTGAAG